MRCVGMGVWDTDPGCTCCVGCCSGEVTAGGGLVSNTGGVGALAEAVVGVVDREGGASTCDVVEGVDWSGYDGPEDR